MVGWCKLAIGIHFAEELCHALFAGLTDQEVDLAIQRSGVPANNSDNDAAPVRVAPVPGLLCSWHCLYAYLMYYAMLIVVSLDCG